MFNRFRQRNSSHQQASGLPCALNMTGRYVFLSLRKNKKPHVSLKYNGKSHIITELRGKQNAAPIAEYYPYIVDIINYLGLIPQRLDSVPYRYFKQDENTGKWSF